MFRALAFKFLNAVSLSRQTADDIVSIESFIDQEIPYLGNLRGPKFSKYIFIL